MITLLNFLEVQKTLSESLFQKVLDLTSSGSIGVNETHSFVATNQNPKVLVAIDNLIQSPIVSTAITTTLGGC